MCSIGKRVDRSFEQNEEDKGTKVTPWRKYYLFNK
jgi:hypothetical protein